jgi:phospholipid/cholesterol/gamma-HCH transport system substrate-binding protein
MSQPRLEVKVGLFVAICLALLAILLIQFSKGASFFRSTYNIVLNAANVGGLRVEASVLMSGVQVGHVTKTVLSPQGTNVAITLSIYSQYVIRDDAVFKIEQSGFLGDQYVAIDPGLSLGNPFKPGAQAHAEEPFNLQEVARSASGFIKRMDDTAKKVNDAIDQVRKLALNENTLTNLSGAVVNLRKASQGALTTVDSVNALIKTNGEPVGHAISNLVAFSRQLQEVAGHVQNILTTNEPQISSAFSNINTSTIMLTNVLDEVQNGKGLAGEILKNQTMANQAADLVRNLDITTANLNRLGFWHWLWYKPPATNAWPADPGPNLQH